MAPSCFWSSSAFVSLWLPCLVLGTWDRHGHRQHAPLNLLKDSRQLQGLPGFDFKDALFPQKYYGDESCPCLSAEEVEASKLVRLDDAYGVDDGELDVNYGVNCGLHDATSSICQAVDLCVSKVPVPPDCDKSWCRRAFCYVDPLTCGVLYKESAVFKDMYYSYATCGYMDSFTYAARINSLKDRQLQVAFNSNTGGWKGAKNHNGSFAVNADWTGPIVEFIKDAAYAGRFSFNITRPPEWLREESKNFFGSSSFDYCVYTTALGYVDLCVAAYTITDKRAAVTPFFEISQDPIYLIVVVDDGQTRISDLYESFLTIFLPFAPWAWFLIAMVFMPLLGMLMVYHEYGAPGSPYPEKIPIFVEHVKTGRKEIQRKPVPWYEYLPKAVYMSYLSFALNAYEPKIMTIGGKVHLLAIQSFVLLTISVYTANLAAILTQSLSKSPVDNLKDAVTAGYTFCAERKVGETVMALHDVDGSRILPDPVDIGGDGKPGFNCPKCNSRSRVFEMMDILNADGETYCHAAFASQEDLDVFHEKGLHCNKDKVGDVLSFSSSGIPLSSSVSEELTSLLYEMKYQGKLDNFMNLAAPVSSCPAALGEGTSLEADQLTGIWAITVFFSFAALLVSYVSPKLRKKKDPLIRKRKLQRFDQWGNSTDDVEINGRHFNHRQDTFVRRKEKTVLEASKANFDFNMSDEDFGDHSDELARALDDRDSEPMTLKMEDEGSLDAPIKRVNFQ